MAVKRNGKGYSHANALIKDGKVNRASSWEFTAEDGNRLLGSDDWTEYGKWFMGVDDAADPKTKEHYKYPFGKGGKVYRRALIAIKSRAAQQGETEIADAADKCLSKVDAAAEAARADAVRCDADMEPWELLAEEEDPVPPSEFRVFQIGENTAKWDDGKTSTFLLDEDAMASIVEAFEAGGKDIEIDYDHKSSRPVTNGPAPAAGWMGLEAREDGLWAVVRRWTEAATAFLRNREYRYFSPEFTHDKKAPFKIRELLAVALTNRPAMLNPIPLAASATTPTAAEAVADNPPIQEPDMSKIIEALGAKTEDEAVAAVETMRASATEKETALAAATAETARVQTELAAATAARDTAEKVIVEIMAAVGCEKREDVIGIVARHKDEAAEVASVRAEAAKAKAAQEEAERETLIASANVAHDRAEWLKKQPIETVRSYVASCCATPEISTTPQSSEAVPRSEDAPPVWFTDLPTIEVLPKDKQAEEWAKHKAHKASVMGTPAKPAPAADAT